jgi:hypothetical protein
VSENTSLSPGWGAQSVAKGSPASSSFEPWPDFAPFALVDRVVSLFSRSGVSENLSMPPGWGALSAVKGSPMSSTASF